MVCGKKFLFVTSDFNIGFMMIRAKQEGNKVRVCSTLAIERIFEGFLDAGEFVKDWKKSVGWADVIVFDDVGWGKEADKLRKRGKAVIGCSEYTDRLEIDRDFGQKELKRKGIRTLGEWQFKTSEEAIEFIKANPRRYVLKPCGLHDMDSTIVGESLRGVDLIKIIEHMSAYWIKKGVDKFFLQEYVDGIEVESGATFDGENFSYPIDISFEHKRLCTGDIGPMTWEMGTVMFYSKINKLFKDTLMKFRDDLRGAGYVGDVGLNCIVNKDGIFPLEFTCRFGFPATQIIWADEKMLVSDYLWNLGNALKLPLVEIGYFVGVTLVLPPFPYNDPIEFTKYQDLPIRVKDGCMDGIFIVDVNKKGEKIYTNGYCPLVVAAKDREFEKALKRAYKRVKNVQIDNMYYRTDIGKKCKNYMKLLKKWGYIN